MRIRSALDRRLVFLGVVLLAASPLGARTKTDVITMQNGDRITCEVKGLDGGVLSIELDYVDGTVSLDWSKVARLESTQLFVVLSQDGSSYEGTLATAEVGPSLPMKIRVGQGEGPEVQMEGSEIVRMTETSEKFLQRFSGAINLGLIYSKGNNATQYTLGTEVQYLRERWAVETMFSSDLSSNSGSTTSTRNQLTLRSYHLLPWENYFYGGQGSFLQSSTQGINLQTTVGGGIGHFFKNTNRTSISVLGGLGWESTDYKQSAAVVGRQNVAAALLSAEIKLFKFKKTNLNLTASLLPALSDPGRLHFDTNATYYLKLFKNLNWNVSFYGNWDNRPPAGFSSSDFGSSSGLSWTFGYK